MFCMMRTSFRRIIAFPSIGAVVFHGDGILVIEVTTSGRSVVARCYSQKKVKYFHSSSVQAELQQRTNHQVVDKSLMIFARPCYLAASHITAAQVLDAHPRHSRPSLSPIYQIINVHAALQLVANRPPSTKTPPWLPRLVTSVP
jgi:hypothetical protein